MATLNIRIPTEEADAPSPSHGGATATTNESWSSGMALTPREMDDDLEEYFIHAEYKQVGSVPSFADQIDVKE